METVSARSTRKQACSGVSSPMTFPATGSGRHVWNS